LHFGSRYLYKAVENNSTRKQLCTQVTTKNSSNMKQLSLFDLFDELQSQSTAEKAGLEKQSNLSSNITASNNASESKKVIELSAQDECDCYLYPDALLLFRVGEFYEAYNDDAKQATEILGITLTKFGKSNIPMCGFPFHALDVYLPKLVRAGKRVAICDQIEDVQRATKNLQKKQVTQYNKL